MTFKFLGIKILLVIGIIFLLAAQSANATTIQINNLDSAGAGLNDATLVSPVGGNPGTTLGDQRHNVFLFALNLWASVIKSNQTIYADATFTSLTCTTTSAILGSASPNTVHANFTNRPLANTVYVQAEANSLAASDLDTTHADLTLRFNSNLDSDPNCLVGQHWYYGLDGQVPAGYIDLLSVVMHELAHGLGFVTFVDLSTGAKFSGLNDAYMVQLEDHSLGKTWPNLADAQRVASAIDTNDLHWKGTNVNNLVSSLTGGVNQGHIMMYAPASLTLGSSVAHFSDAIAPDDLMEPFYTGAKNNLGIAPQAFKDMGWVLYANPAPVIGPLNAYSLFDSDSLTISIALRDMDTDLSNVNLTATSSNTGVVSASNLSISGSGNLRILHLIPNAAGTTNITLTATDPQQSMQTNFQVTVVLNNQPALLINSPINNATNLISSVNFSATANDIEDRNLNSQIQWYSSIDGYLGQGASLTHNLSDGAQQITAKVTDSHQKTTQVSINLTVAANADFDGDGLSNSTEISMGSDPYKADTDGDGIPDGIDPQPLIANTPSTPIPVAPNGLFTVCALFFIYFAIRRLQIHRTFKR